MKGQQIAPLGSIRHVLVAKKELKTFVVENDDKCIMCNKPDSIGHTVLECQEFLELVDNSLKWFNTLHGNNFSISPLEVLLNHLP